MDELDTYRKEMCTRIEELAEIVRDTIGERATASTNPDTMKDLVAKLVYRTFYLFTDESARMCTGHLFPAYYAAESAKTREEIGSAAIKLNESLQKFFACLSSIYRCGEYGD